MESVGEFGLCIDMKMMLALLGKQSASCTHACPFCECSAPWTCPCPANTLGSLSNHYNNYVADGSRPQNAKKFQNCTRPALLSGSPDTPIISLINFSELHALTGITGKLVNEMIAVFRNKDKGGQWVENFMAENNISWCVYRPQTFEGNQARKFIRLSGKLLERARYLPLLDAIPVLQFCRTLVLFNKVVISCFGQGLDPDFRTAIKEFCACYRLLDISATPKFHLVERHAVEFIEMNGETSGLGAWSEQPFESVHADFKKELERSKVSPNHPNYAEILLNVVMRYNAKHVS